MIHSISKYLNVKTPTEMWDLCHTIYHHPEYRTEYEHVYRDKYDEVVGKYDDYIQIYNWLIEGTLLQKKGLTLIEFSIEFSVTKDKNFDTSKVKEELSEVLDLVIDHIVLNTNIEVYNL